MSMSVRLVPVAIAGFAALIAFQSPAKAAVVQPCLTNAASSITFLPINGGGQTYCQSAYGWSDTWFPTAQPSTYNQQLDALSGDNAPDLTFTYLGANGPTTVGSGNAYNFISPYLDGGTLNSALLPGGSAWTVLSDLTVSGNVGTSTIALNGLDLTITTTVGASGVTEQFAFTNTNPFDIDVLFSDYFNFHPNGSLSGDLGCATTSFDSVTGTVTTTGSNAGGCSKIVSSGTMQGSQSPLEWDLGLSTNVLSDIAGGSYNDGLGPYTGDGAVDVVWDLGPLSGTSCVPGELTVCNSETSFTISKNFAVPEPGSLGVVGSALAGLGFFGWRRQKSGATT